MVRTWARSRLGSTRPDAEPTINEAGEQGFAIDGTDSFSVPGPADGLPPELGDEDAIARARRCADCSSRSARRPPCCSSSSSSDAPVARARRIASPAPPRVRSSPSRQLFGDPIGRGPRRPRRDRRVRRRHVHRPTTTSSRTSSRTMTDSTSDYEYDDGTFPSYTGVVGPVRRRPVLRLRRRLRRALRPEPHDAADVPPVHPARREPLPAPGAGRRRDRGDRPRGHDRRRPTRRPPRRRPPRHRRRRPRRRRPPRPRCRRRRLRRGRRRRPHSAWCARRIRCGCGPITRACSPASAARVWRSTDGGATWSPISLGAVPTAYADDPNSTRSCGGLGRHVGRSVQDPRR